MGSGDGIGNSLVDLKCRGGITKRNKTRRHARDGAGGNFGAYVFGSAAYTDREKGKEAREVE